MSSLLVINGLDQMVPSGITTASSNDAIIIALQTNQLYNKVINQYYNIMKNVEYRSVGKDSFYNLMPQYATSGTSNINCALSRQYMSHLHNNNHLFTRVLNLAVAYLSEIKRRTYKKSVGLDYPVCGLLGGRCR
tara:strand:- start:1802 stop:2203 length:402 start_codon:yes stop_codon:yes gene_type:complete